MIGCTQLNAGGTCPAANRVLGIAGDASPDFTMGFSNDVTAGPFRLGTLVDWRRGGMGVNFTNNYFDFGIPQDTAVARARRTAYAAGQPAYLENTGFVKLREVTLSYTLPRALLGRLLRGGAQDARLELSGRNLYTWTSYSGLDPEVSNFGNQPVGRFIDLTSYPPSRIFFASIATTF